MTSRLSILKAKLRSSYPYKGLEIFRFLVGLILFTFYFNQLIHIEWIWTDPAYSTNFTRPGLAHIFLKNLLPNGWGFKILLLICVPSAFCLMMGIYSRIFGFILLLASTPLSSSDHITFWGFMGPTRFFLIYSILIHCHWKLWERPKAGYKKYNNTWYLIVSIHVILVYYVPLIIRVQNFSWYSGYEVIRVVLYPLFLNFRLSPDFVLNNLILFKALTYLTIGLEGASLGIIFLKKNWRKNLILLLILFHISLFVVTTLIWWQSIMMTGLICSYYWQGED